ncbi:MAG: ABC transporter ATP-binding protein [Candidatus Cloacimonetes bacterium]|nr:ABC transporter ATP-binding protein [Candidatus Cloacimonadota bacterium]
MNKIQKPKAGKNLRRIYATMFQSWPLLASGTVAMLLYAIFNGISVTLVIPLFDYVFKPGDGGFNIATVSGLFKALGQAWQAFWSGGGNGFPRGGINALSPLWEQVRQIMLNSDPITLLYGFCIFLVVIILLKNIFFYLQRVLFIKLRANAVRKLREDMFGAYLQQSQGFFNQARTGDAMVRMVSDVEIVGESYVRSLLEGILDIVTILIFARIAMLLNPRLFVYGLVVVPVFTLFVGWLGKQVKRNSARIQAQLSALFSSAEEVLSGMKIVKAFRRENAEKQDFNRVNSAYVRFWKKAQYYTSLSVPLSEINTVLTGVIVIILGGKMILAPGSVFSLGDFTAFLLAIFSLLHPMKNLTQIYADLKKATVSLERIFEVLDRSSEVEEAPEALPKEGFESEIVFDKVSFCYRENQPVLKDLSFRVRKGEKLALVGSSGGGKTTLANLFNRIFDVGEGAIFLDGRDIRDYKLDALRKLFGVVTQESILFSKTVREIIAYGALEELSFDRIQQAARIAHAEEFILELPAQYDEPLQNKGANLSGGQKQRLCIARAIAGDPPILIFDEATSALDTESEKLVQEAIDAATQNRTVIMIAHRLSTVMKADRILVLERGKLVGEGSHEELLRSCPRYQELYSAQFKDGVTQSNDLG